MNMSKDVVYLDNNATTRVAPEVLDTMLPFLTDFYGNASSIHRFGGQVHKPIDEAREQLANLLGALPEEIVFTSCGTESDNAAILSALENDVSRRTIVTTRVEHPAILGLCSVLQERGTTSSTAP